MCCMLSHFHGAQNNAWHSGTSTIEGRQGHGLSEESRPWTQSLSTPVLNPLFKNAYFISNALPLLEVRAVALLSSLFQGPKLV